MTDVFAPWLTDPDDPADIPTPADPGAAAKAIFAMFPELVDHSNDGLLATILDGADQAVQKLATDPTDPEAKRIVAVFNQAISIIDASEPKIRDMIESGMMDVAGVSGTKVSGGIKAVKDLSAQIAHVRQHHIKAAFRHLRKHLPSDE